MVKQALGHILLAAVFMFLFPAWGLLYIGKNVLYELKFKEMVQDILVPQVENPNELDNSLLAALY